MTVLGLLATIVDSKALLETCLAALVSGIGVTLTFSLAILGATRFSEASRDQRTLEAAAFGVLALLAFAATAGAIVAGIVVMVGD